MQININLDKKTQNLIQTRLKEFDALNKQSNNEWFSELCFCLLTANSKAQTGIDIQEAMNSDGFLKKTPTEITSILKEHGHRFYNIRTKYIVAARKYENIKDIVTKMDGFEARKWLVDNIKGIGYKEASHFLRNVGYKDVAILDRHILRFLHQEKLIDKIPKTITPKKYLEFEKILSKFNIPQNELDLIIWAKMTGKVLK